MSRAADRCIHGHEFTPANTGYKRDRLGRKVRFCLMCQRTRQRRHQTRRRGAA